MRIRNEYFTYIKYDELLKSSTIIYSKQKLFKEFLINYPYNKKCILQWKISKNDIMIINNTKYIKLSLIIKA